ncbi:alpha/beta hydrolase [Flavobacterium urocaniciphilum]|uniref:Serine aminopeptidase, S33 n=1 Tax=Flavobacterium urocaniciphilum TaxID=1299341 RepID=A0A1H8YRF3_9FLAO|nr:alpha/beta hydrolase [Flavobacterium urocaniciphilum]SEP54673.1 Serine aminopeptidase, S33 [Flavobacterium urocaniciphilum]
MNFKKIMQKSMGFYFNFLSFVNPKKLKKDGFELFCNPFARKVKPHQLEFLQKGISDVLDLEGYQIQTYKWGSGSKHILLVHGWASHSFRWKNYIEHLIKNDFTVYALDAPAHGLSSGKSIHVVLYAKVINAFLELHSEIKSIVSHSIGGFATTYFLDQYKEHTIEKVVIMGAPGEASDFFDFYKETLGLTTKSLNLIIDEFYSQLGKLPSYFSSAKFAESIMVPALIVHDKNDLATNYYYSIRLNKHWKNSELILTEGLGHDLKSKELVKQVTEFVLN